MSLLDDRYLATDGSAYLTGIQALVRMLLDRQRHDDRLAQGGSVYVTGYEGSPLAGYDLEMQRRHRLLAEHRIVHAPALNEELAATALAGTQLAGQVAALTTRGVTGFWYGKAPGLDRATDAIRHAAIIGTSAAGGVVALVGDDPSAKSSTVPSSSEAALADLQLPTFYPADSQEVLEHGLHAVELSRASGLWTAMKIATSVADGAATVVLPPAWTAPVLDGLPDGLRAYSHVPHARLLGQDLIALERSMQQARWPLAVEYLRRSGLNRIFGPDRARIGIVTTGKTYLDVRQALTSLGLGEKELTRLGVRVLKLGAIIPVEPTIVREFARGLDEIIVVEDKRAFLEVAVRNILYGTVDAPVVAGKRDPRHGRLFTEVGELDPELIAAGLTARLREHSGFEWLPIPDDQRARERVMLPLAPRTPYFCSGCPHNSSTKPPAGSVIGGGIGCHAMVLMMPEEQVGAVTGLSQMGGEGAQWIGMAPFVEPRHFVQNLGDGTFAHSGSLAVRAAVAAGFPITFKILFNSAVAMTGGQSAAGGQGGIGQLVARVLAEGVSRVVVTTEQPARVRRALRHARVAPHGRVSVKHRAELPDVQSQLAQEAGVTVLVHDQECAAEKRRKRKRGALATPATVVMINERVCEGCGDCGAKSNCLSVRPVQTEYGRKTRIHQSSCNFDYSCLSGDCPSFTKVMAGPKASAGAVPTAVADRGNLPEPVTQTSADDFRLRITGIGGTGVVTIAQVIATAAALDGRYVRALDQTGLAQKGGAVVSDVKISGAPILRAAKLAGGECDLYLGCDSLVATDPVQLKAADPERTVAVASTAEVPTGLMVVDPDESFPSRDRIRAAFDGRVAEAHFVPADELSRSLFGDEQFANMLLVGAAYQIGALPLSARAIEEAIGLNGTRVESNLQAFRHGRQFVVAASEQSESAAPELVDVAGLIASRSADLAAYQDSRYAQAYVRFASRVRELETQAVPGETALTEAVARNLYKLMAYKDEYEVARLSLDPGFEAAVRAERGPDARISYLLHPPVFRALGLRRKLSLGRWFKPAFRALYAMRRLRGTAWDPFGHSHVRRTERELVAEYRAIVERALEGLNAATHERAVTLAELPDLIRGYEDIKLESVSRYRSRLAEVLREGATEDAAAALDSSNPMR
jgi:indolepyruvate ferredoxin oxidoreductase